MIALFVNYKSLSDGQLMERVRRKDDEHAFAEIYRRYARLLQGFFFRRLGGDVEQSSDHMQDTFLKVWSSRWNYSDGQSFRTWIFTIAYNLCKNTYRQNQHEQEYLDSLPTDEPIAEDSTPLKLDAATFDSALQQELARLNEAQQEIAAIIDIPEGTVKSRLNTLTNYLRLKLKDYE